MKPIKGERYTMTCVQWTIARVNIIISISGPVERDKRSVSAEKRNGKSHSFLQCKSTQSK